jgi:hypothetical protein
MGSGDRSRSCGSALKAAAGRVHYLILGHRRSRYPMFMQKVRMKKAA